MSTIITHKDPPIAGIPLHGTDDRIESAFRTSYVFRTYLRDDTVHVSAKNGMVTLTGAVSEEFHRGMAEETATNLPGVTGVDNQITTLSETAAENVDTWISRKVKLALLLRRNVSYASTTVDVKDGVVTLTGTASSVAQKELTGEYASDIENVTKVRNEIVVKAEPAPPTRTAGEKFDDASISAQVKTALLTHRSTNSVQTKVETRDGAVSITGIARNAAEKALVTKLVHDVHGVSAVKNEMTIEEVKSL